MVLSVFSIYDDVTKTYSQPIFTVEEDGSYINAFRIFLNMCQKPGMISDNPNDYQLVKLGTYDDKAGEFVNTMINYCYAEEVIAAIKENPDNDTNWYYIYLEGDE